MRKKDKFGKVNEENFKIVVGTKRVMNFLQKI